MVDTATRGPQPHRRWPRLLGFSAAVGLATLVGLTPASSEPGNPGVPGDPVEVFHEDFENGVGDGELILLGAYVGANGETYDAEHEWDNPEGCNGFVMDGTATDATIAGAGCAAGSGLSGRLRELATLVGELNGTTPPETNHALSALSFLVSSPSGAIQLRTVAPLGIEVENRFLVFSANASATNCISANDAQPQLFFFLDDGAEELPVNDTPLNPCDSGQETGATTLVSDGSVLFSGQELGIVVRNAEGGDFGNDAAIDDIRIVDATPQLDKEFQPTSARVGSPVELLFTITNTSDLAAKQGWSFVDTLPAGLTIVDPEGATTDCANGQMSVSGDSISMSGDLSSGQAFCTASVAVQSDEPGTFSNDASNVSGLVGLNPPGPASVTLDPDPQVTTTTVGTTTTTVGTTTTTLGTTTTTLGTTTTSGTAEVAGETLPRTGSGFGVLTAVALAFVGAGISLLGASRRHYRSRSQA